MAGGAGDARASCPTRGSVIFETRTNQLFVTDIPSKLEEVQAADRQDRHSGAPGADRGAHRRSERHLRPLAGRAPRRRATCAACAAAFRATRSAATTASPSAATTTPSEGRPRQTPAGRHFANTQFVNLPAIGQGGFDPATFALSLFSCSANRFLNLEISALEADGKGKIVSSPRIVTADQVKALDRARARRFRTSAPSSWARPRSSSTRRP